MKDGFIRVAAATPDLKVADPVFNREQTWKMMQEAAARDVKSSYSRNSALPDIHAVTCFCRIR